MARQHVIPDTDIIVLPGGFSHGDYLRSGAMAALYLSNLYVNLGAIYCENSNSRWHHERRVTLPRIDIEYASPGFVNGLM